MKNFGEQFLHQTDGGLHTSPAVEHTREKLQKRGEDVSQKPADKIEAFLKRFDSILNPAQLEGHDGFDRKERNIEFLKKKLHDTLLISLDDIPESYWENQKNILREQGHGDVEIDAQQKQGIHEVLYTDQKSTLDTWIRYLTSPDSDGFPTWAKYWAFTNMLKLSKFDKEKHSFSKRGKGTTAPFPDLNREALAYVIDAIEKKAEISALPSKKERRLAMEELGEDDAFATLLETANFGKLYAHAIEKVTPTDENVLTNTEGVWVKYEQGSDHMPLVQSLQGHGTGWCTAGESTAEHQLENGDFYVYYSLDTEGKPTIPRAAIRMDGNATIGEVRGIAEEQNLDPYIGNVVNKKLDAMPDSQKYRKKTADMKQLTEIDRRHKSGTELTSSDLRFLYEMDASIEGFGYNKDPRIGELLKGRDARGDIAQIIGYTREEVSITKEEALSGNIRYHHGNLDLFKIAEGIVFPKTVGGDLSLHELTSTKGLVLPETVEGNLKLDRLTSAEGLVFPKTVRGDLDLIRLTSTKGLVLPETVGGVLYLAGLTSAEGLVLPKMIDGGFVNLQRLTDTEKNILSKKYPHITIV